MITQVKGVLMKSGKAVEQILSVSIQLDKFVSEESKNVTNDVTKVLEIATKLQQDVISMINKEREVARNEVANLLIEARDILGNNFPDISAVEEYLGCKI